jgi:hypothetical protein
VKIIIEGAEIYCERRGNGPLLLLIHGAMEDAGFYSAALISLLNNLQLCLMIDDVTLAALEIEALK